MRYWEDLQLLGIGIRSTNVSVTLRSLIKDKSRSPCLCLTDTSLFLSWYLSNEVFLLCHLFLYYLLYIQRKCLLGRAQFAIHYPNHRQTRRPNHPTTWRYATNSVVSIPALCTLGTYTILTMFLAGHSRRVYAFHSMDTHLPKPQRLMVKYSPCLVWCVVLLKIVQTL